MILAWGLRAGASPAHPAWVAGQGPPARPIRHVWGGPGVYRAYECRPGCARPICQCTRDGRGHWRGVGQPALARHGGMGTDQQTARTGGGVVRGRPDRVRPGPRAARRRNPVRGRSTLQAATSLRGTGQDRRQGCRAAVPAAEVGRVHPGHRARRGGRVGPGPGQVPGGLPHRSDAGPAPALQAAAAPSGRVLRRERLDRETFGVVGPATLRRSEPAMHPRGVSGPGAGHDRAPGPAGRQDRTVGRRLPCGPRWCDGWAACAGSPR